MNRSSLSRRSFVNSILALALSPNMARAVETGSSPGEAPPTFSMWMHGFGGEDIAQTARALRDAGFTTVVAGGGATIEAVNNAGMTSWLSGGAFGIGNAVEEQDLRAIDVFGEPQLWFGSGCPNKPQIRERNLKNYESMAKTDGIEGILVDGCRFASPASGIDAFATCYCDTCHARAQDLGFDFVRMQNDVRRMLESFRRLAEGNEIVWPDSPVHTLEWLTEHQGIVEWLKFRRICVTEHFRSIRAVLNAAGVKMGVYIFTPSLAPLVGQSYRDLSGFVDVFAPMIYRNYPDSPGEACLNWELSAIPDALGVAGTEHEAAAVEAMLRFTGLRDLTTARTIGELRKGLPPTVVHHETRLVRTFLTSKNELIPIIYIDDPEMDETIHQVREGGADGVNFFLFKPEWKRLLARVLTASAS